MKKTDQTYEPHLVIREMTVRSGAEWLARSPGWSLVLIKSGTGYSLQPQSTRELEPGTVILMTGRSPGRIRASQLGTLTLSFFTVIPSRLTGLITLGEQDFLAQAASRSELAVSILPPNHPAAIKMQQLCAAGNANGLWFRLNLLRIFVEAFGNDLQQAATDWEAADARQRLQVLLEQTPPAELLEMSFEELARSTYCTPRHLSRIFRELVGMSFRDKRAELRLTRARDLLANSKSKVVEVALESGYKSLSLFNLMFTRHFGTSPGRWRQKYQANGNFKNLQNKRVRQLAA